MNKTHNDFLSFANLSLKRQKKEEDKATSHWFEGWLDSDSLLEKPELSLSSIQDGEHWLQQISWLGLNPFLKS